MQKSAKKAAKSNEEYVIWAAQNFETAFREYVGNEEYERIPAGSQLMAIRKSEFAAMLNHVAKGVDAQNQINGVKNTYKPQTDGQGVAIVRDGVVQKVIQ